MNSAWAPALLAVLVVSAVSLIGAIAGMRLFRRHSVIIALVALAAGSLLGDALLHLLPEAAEVRGGFDAALGFWVIAGFGAFFVLEVVLRLGHDHGEVLHADHDHPGHGHEHGHGHRHGQRAHPSHPVVARDVDKAATASADGEPAKPVAPFAWMNLVGDGLHNFLDGIVIAAAFVVDTEVGIATTVAVILHEIPQELGDFAVLLRSGMKPAKAVLFNLASALTSVLGALLFLVMPFDTATLESIALPLAAGGFLYIAAADLIPELHHHTGDRHVRHILVGFVVGLAAMAGMLLLEA